MKAVRARDVPLDTISTHSDGRILHLPLGCLVRSTVIRPPLGNACS